MSIAEPVGIPVAVALGFVRLACNRSANRNPLAVDQACDTVMYWFKAGAILEEFAHNALGLLRAAMKDTHAGTKPAHGCVNRCACAPEATNSMQQRPRLHAFRRAEGKKPSRPMTPRGRTLIKEDAPRLMRNQVHQ